MVFLSTDLFLNERGQARGQVPFRQQVDRDPQVVGTDASVEDGAPDP